MTLGTPKCCWLLPNYHFNTTMFYQCSKAYNCIHVASILMEAYKYIYTTKVFLPYIAILQLQFQDIVHTCTPMFHQFTRLYYSFESIYILSHFILYIYKGPQFISCIKYLCFFNTQIILAPLSLYTCFNFTDTATRWCHM